MAGRLLTSQSTLLCPHGGQVQATTTNSKVSAGSGAYVLRLSDTFTVSGCPFQIPAPSGTVPSPCVLVRWVSADMRVRVEQQSTLSEGSVGLCLSALQVPQGQVIVVDTQLPVSGQ